MIGLPLAEYGYALPPAPRSGIRYSPTIKDRTAYGTITQDGSIIPVAEKRMLDLIDGISGRELR
jgi:hypothetical protein